MVDNRNVRYHICGPGKETTMSRIAVFFSTGYEEIEALTVVDLCRRAGIETVMVSIDTERTVTGSHGIPV